MKRVLSLVLIVILMLSTTSKNVFAASYGETENEGDKYLSESALTNLWLEGRQSFELIESKDDKYFTSRFFVGSTIYQVEEVISDDLSSVESKFYVLGELGKEYIGQQTTLIEKEGEYLNVSVMEDGEVIDSQSYDVVDNSLDTQKPSNNVSETLTANAAVETKWFSQGIYNGSNNIYRYTVAAIVAALAAAAGSPAAAGLAAIAGMAIGEQWTVIYWTCETWVLCERSSSWPSYPDWIMAGQYLYQTWYYSDSARTNQIGYTTHLEG
jgi:hypothetical protein